MSSVGETFNYNVASAAIIHKLEFETLAECNLTYRLLNTLPYFINYDEKLNMLRVQTNLSADLGDYIVTV